MDCDGGDGGRGYGLVFVVMVTAALRVADKLVLINLIVLFFVDIYGVGSGSGGSDIGGDGGVVMVRYWWYYSKGGDDGWCDSGSCDYE